MNFSLLFSSANLLRHKKGENFSSGLFSSDIEKFNMLCVRNAFYWNFMSSQSIEGKKAGKKLFLAIVK